MIPRMKTYRLLSLALLVVLGCSSESPRDRKPPHPRMDPTLENPVVFNVDFSTPMPLVSLLVTPEEAVIMRARYSSFFIEMGPAGKTGTLTLRFDKKGSLGTPWNFYLRNFASPYPVRLMGVLPDGKKEVIHEETY